MMPIVQRHQFIQAGGAQMSPPRFVSCSAYGFTGWFTSVWARISSFEKKPDVSGSR